MSLGSEQQRETPPPLGCGQRTDLSLGRCVERGYREAISQALFDHVIATRVLALCLQG